MKIEVIISKYKERTIFKRQVNISPPLTTIIFIY